MPTYAMRDRINADVYAIVAALLGLDHDRYTLQWVNGKWNDWYDEER